MIKIFNNVVATLVFFLVYICVYYLIAHDVTASSLVLSVIFFILLVLVDAIRYDDED